MQNIQLCYCGLVMLIGTCCYLFSIYFHWDPRNEVGSQSLVKQISQINELVFFCFGVGVLSHCATPLYENDDGMDSK